MGHPSRFVHAAEARARFGDRAERLGDYLRVGDPLADAAVSALAAHSRAERMAQIDRALAGDMRGAPDALVALVDDAGRVPFWVDTERADRGGTRFLEAGWIGGVVLALYSLVAGYCSPAGNKPLAFSGRLREHAPRRLAETSRFVQAVSLPGGMARAADGFAITLKVRLMHAQVRSMLQASPQWDAAAWGVPINQADMAGTLILFSWIVVDGLDKLGLSMRAREAEDLIHLWRWIGHVIGVAPDLAPASVKDAKLLWEMLAVTQEPPDADSQALAAALIESSAAAARTREEKARIEQFGYGASRFLIGDAYADALGFPRTVWPRVLRLTRPALRAVHGAAARTEVGHRLARTAGMRHWSNVVQTGLSGVPATFGLPDRLAVSGGVR